MQPDYFGKRLLECPVRFPPLVSSIQCYVLCCVSNIRRHLTSRLPPASAILFPPISHVTPPPNLELHRVRRERFWRAVCTLACELGFPFVGH
jgi:hypothetical protein